MKKIGILLKEEREKQGLSVSDISDRTKIHAQKIEALEKGDYSLLPAKVFAKGLIRSYASILKLDPQWIQELCDAEFEETDIPPPSIHPPEEITSDETTAALVNEQTAKNTPSMILIFSALGAFALCFLIYLTFQKINRYKSEEILPEEIWQESTTINNEGTAAEDKSKDDDSTIDSSSKSNKDSTAKDIIVPKALPKKEIKKIPFEKTDDTLKDKNQIQNFEKPLKPKKTDPQPVKIYANNKLILTAIDSVRIEIIWSDGKPQVMLLKAQERKTLVFSNPLIVKINNGGAVSIQFNRKNVGIPGTLNQPIELKYP